MPKKHKTRSTKDSKLDFSTLIYTLKTAVQAPNSDKNTAQYPYRGRKPRAMTDSKDVGQVTDIDDTRTILKVGMSLSLFEMMLQKLAQERAQEDLQWSIAHSKTYFQDMGHLDHMHMAMDTLHSGSLENRSDKDYVREYVGYFVSNFLRITDLKEPVSNKKIISQAIQERMIKAIKDFIKDPDGKAMLDRVANGEFLTYEDIYRLITPMLQTKDFIEIEVPVENISKEDSTAGEAKNDKEQNKKSQEKPVQRKYSFALRDVVALVAFSDTMYGGFSQHMVNKFHLSKHHPVARHRILLQPLEQPGVFQASNFIDVNLHFDEFLLAPFKETKKLRNQTVAEWAQACGRELELKLVNMPIHGLCSTTLLRHIAGESADNGPDNAILVSAKKHGGYSLIPVDLTGFRFPRKEIFKEGNNVERLGWEKTLIEKNVNTLLDRLFNKTVFSSRFIEKGLPYYDAPTRQDIFNAITVVLKKNVQNLVLKEVNAVREWYHSMNADAELDSLREACELLYNKLPPQMQFDKEYLEKLIAHCQQFIRDPIEVSNAMSCNPVQSLKEANREPSPSSPKISAQSMFTPTNSGNSNPASYREGNSL